MKNEENITFYGKGNNAIWNNEVPSIKIVEFHIHKEILETIKKTSDIWKCNQQIKFKKIIGLKEEFFGIFDFQFLQQIIINQKKINLPEWFNSDTKKIKLEIFLKNGEKTDFSIEGEKYCLYLKFEDLNRIKTIEIIYTTEKK